MNFPIIPKFVVLTSILFLFANTSCDLDPSEDEPDLLTPRFSLTPSATPCKVPCQVSVDASSSEGATSYSWDFGDNSLEKVGVTATHTYDSVGTFTITLTATGSGGSSTTTQTQTVADSTSPPSPNPPHADFEIDSISNNGFAPATVWFRNTSTDADTYEWDFGNSTSPDNSSTEPNPLHTYQNSGFFTVTLTATQSESGESDVHTENIPIENTLAFIETFYGGAQELGREISLAQRPDNGFVILSRNEDSGGFNWSNYLIFANEMGDFLNTSEIFANLFDTGLSIISKQDGEIAFVGQTGDDRDFVESYLYFTDGVGNETHKTIVSRSDFDAARDIVQSSNSTLAILGHSGDNFLLSLSDAEGTLLPGTPQAIAMGGTAKGNSISTRRDGGYVLAGSSLVGQEQIALVLTDANGIPFPGSPKLFSLGAGSTDEALSVIELVDGGYAMVGNSFDGSFNHGFLLLTDNNGNALSGFPKRMTLPNGRVEELRSIVQQPNGNLAMAGTGYRTSSSDSDIILILTDSDGNLFPGSIKFFDVENNRGNDFGTDMILTSDGGLALVGTHSGSDNVVLIKTNAAGEIE